MAKHSSFNIDVEDFSEFLFDIIEDLIEIQSGETLPHDSQNTPTHCRPTYWNLTFLHLLSSKHFVNDWATTRSCLEILSFKDVKHKGRIIKIIVFIFLGNCKVFVNIFFNMFLNFCKYAIRICIF